MNELKIFEISKKRTLIAMQEWLRKWQMPLVARVYCPNCKSQKVNKRMQSKQGKTHRCSECQRDFSLEELAECRCTYPGGLLKCIDCKHYQDMMRYVERRKAGLERLNEEQLDAIMSAREFWQRDMERRLPELEGSQNQFDFADLFPSGNTTGTSFGLQLSFFGNELPIEGSSELAENDDSQEQ